MKFRASTKIAVGVVALAAAGYYGYQFFAASQVDRAQFAPIAPGRVNLVAVSPEAGYRIIVANRIAQLGELSDPRQIGSRDFDPEESQTINRKRVPIRELLQCLQGKAEAAGPMVMAMNDLIREDLPPDGIVWKAEDIRKALDGDVALAQKLQRDVNANLDGTFPSFIRESAVFGGLILDLPVTIQVQVAGKPTQLTGRIQEEFRTDAMVQLERQFDKDRFVEGEEYSKAVLAESYVRLVRKIESEGGNRLRQELSDRIDPARLQNFAQSPERVLRSAEIVLNDDFIEGARVEKVEIEGKDPSYTVHLDLTNEGRLRLWKFSRARTGFQLLFIVDGIAIAAPIISKELPFDQVTISRISDEGLAQSAVQAAQEAAQIKQKNQGESL